MTTVKEDVRAMLDQLPDDCSLEDIQYRLYVLGKIRRGLEAVEQGRTHTHQQVRERIRSWGVK